MLSQESVHSSFIGEDKPSPSPKYSVSRQQVTEEWAALFLGVREGTEAEHFPLAAPQQPRAGC